jgi:hypothetical protein
MKNNGQRSSPSSLSSLSLGDQIERVAPEFREDDNTDEEVEARKEGSVEDGDDDKDKDNGEEEVGVSNVIRCNVLLGRVVVATNARFSDGTSSTISSSDDQNHQHTNENDDAGSDDDDDDDTGCYSFVQMSVPLSNELPEGSGVVDCSRFDGKQK